MPPITRMEGRVFGNWTVLHIGARGVDRHITWDCICVCGTVRSIGGQNLRFGHSKGCGCTKPGLRKRPYEALYNSLVRMTDHAVEMTYEEFLEFTSIEECFYCGKEVTFSAHHITKHGSNYHLDRKDNNRGYSKENCVVCCPRCNQAKSNHFTYEEFVQIGALIRSWQKALCPTCGEGNCGLCG